ncbi:hypothetical protein CDD82_7525 [Ophiocordyceps australis]|uniref:MFS transporter n=1 Tax=Ophiocordyceps australis TaxID=1399860 RepID=A0A2C5ZQ35_9HYPO|nr:hypothetical protein CDD82_7525 [Ophiocordyceps australis]
MARLQHMLVFVFTLASLLAIASASSAPTFCKCTCFKNSTIIPLGPASQTPSSSSSQPALLARFVNFARPVDAHTSIGYHSRRSVSTSCTECTKAFCLSQGIDFCKDAEEENVFTLCFQRDSNKDKIFVWAFILGTVGLLGWAAFKRVVEWREKRATSRQNISYTPVAEVP